MNVKNLFLRIALLATVLVVTAALTQPVQAVTGCAAPTTFCTSFNLDGTSTLGNCSNCYCILRDRTSYYDPIDCSAPIP